MSWNPSNQRSIGITCSLGVGIGNGSVTLQTKPGGPENRFLKNATDNYYSPSSTRSNSPSGCPSLCSTTGSVSSLATISEDHVSEADPFEKHFESNNQYINEHLCSHGFSNPKPRNLPNSSFPNDPADSTPRKPQIEKDTAGKCPSNQDRTNNVTSFPGGGKPEEIDSDFDDDDLDSVDEELYNDEWSGEPDRIETDVLAIVDDLGLAAWLIIELHRDQIHSEAQKIGGWQRGIVNCQDSSGSSDKQGQTSTSSYSDQKTPLRKRRRTSESDDRFSDDGDGEERDGSEGNGPPVDQVDGLTSQSILPQYACPFNKLYPARFCDSGAPNHKFRACEFGFKNIQRVKEHIKRKHLVIQCERCYKNFSVGGAKKEDSIAELAKHRREPTPCDLGGFAEEHIGINLTQESLLGETRGKRRQKITDTGRWFNIWDIIFPGNDRPSHPWVETSIPKRTRPPSDHAQSVVNLFHRLLQREIDSGRIRSLPEETMSHIAALLLPVINVYGTITGTPSLVNTSSGGQTETQSLMPTTPLMVTHNQQVVDTKINDHRTQTIPIRDPRTGSAPLDSQPPFNMLQQTNTVNLGYVPQTFSLFEDQLSSVSAAHVPGPSGPSGELADLNLEPAEFGWAFGNLNDWSSFSGNTEMTRFSDNTDMFMQPEEQS